MNNLPVTREELVCGMVVFKWHDSGAFGMQPMYAEVVRVNRVTATICWLSSGITRRVPFHELHSVSDQEAAEIRAEIAARIKQRP